MGGSSKTVQQKPSYDQNKLSERNKYDLSVQRRKAKAQENENRKLQYARDKEKAGWEAGNAARDDVSQERQKMIKDSGKMLTDFERQERRRLLEAKKGVGQVSAEDNRLSDADRKAAEENLSRGEDYWKVRRDQAFKNAQGNALSRFGGLVGKYAQQGLGALYQMKEDFRPADVKGHTNPFKDKNNELKPKNTNLFGRLASDRWDKLQAQGKNAGTSNSFGSNMGGSRGSRGSGGSGGSGGSSLFSKRKAQSLNTPAPRAPAPRAPAKPLFRLPKPLFRATAPAKPRSTKKLPRHQSMFSRFGR